MAIETYYKKESPKMTSLFILLLKSVVNSQRRQGKHFEVGFHSEFLWTFRLCAGLGASLSVRWQYSPTKTRTAMNFAGILFAGIWCNIVFGETFSRKSKKSPELIKFFIGLSKFFCFVSCFGKINLPVGVWQRCAEPIICVFEVCSGFTLPTFPFQSVSRTSLIFL